MSASDNMTSVYRDTLCNGYHANGELERGGDKSLYLCRSISEDSQLVLLVFVLGHVYVIILELKSHVQRVKCQCLRYFQSHIRN